MPSGTHEYIQDPRNENVLIYINGEILARSEAKVSVFDSGFLLGDGVWEGIRLHNGQLVFCEEHIDRLYSCLLYTSPSPRDYAASRMPSSA